MFYQKVRENRVKCQLCYRFCEIADGGRGFCRNRENQAGILYSLVYGRPSAIHVSPVELEPQYHFHPGVKMLCIGTASCNFRCKYCHNYLLSQTSIEQVHSTRYTPEEMVKEASNRDVQFISFTYNEPTVFYEYMYDIARLAKKKGLKIIFHSNGAMNPEPLRTLLKEIDGVTIDLKGFTNKFYQIVSEAELEPVLKTLQIIKEEGIWLEIVNLVVLSLNDTPSDIRKMCKWINNNLGSKTPVHFNRFLPSYLLTSLPPTPVNTLENAYAIACEEGLRYVYIGNVAGHPHNSTYCPECEELLIERYQFVIKKNAMEDGRCNFCKSPIPGVWN